MFSGLVLGLGRIRVNEMIGEGEGLARRLAISVDGQLTPGLSIGSSLAVAGVCLTIVALNGDEVVVEVSPETLARTRLGNLLVESVNLEPALRAGDEMGGHWVQGHVDGQLEVVDRRDLGAHRELSFTLPAESAHLVVEKGSIAIDGVSLTIADLASGRFSVALIPHTLSSTTLGSLQHR